MTSLPNCYRCGNQPCTCADGICIINADCLEVLPLLEPGSVDLVLTDPPYGLGDKWNGGTWGSDPMYADAKRWDRGIDQSLLDLAIQSGKNAIVWGGNYFTLPPCRGFLLWVKIPKMDTMADAEFAWTTFDFVSKSYNETRNKDGKRFHPTQKPQHLMRWCIEFANSRQPNETVLDPFLGSGTTLRACKDLGRRGIGIEIEEKYCEIAARRLEQEVLF